MNKRFFIYKNVDGYNVFTHARETHADPVSRSAFIPEPQNSTNVDLPPEKPGHQRYFKDGAWHYVVDNIGTDYWLADGTKHTITELGEELPEGALLEEPPKPEPTFDALLAATLAQRSAAYKAESDPLYIEWQYDQTDEGEAKWREKVQEIKQRYPLPTE